MHVSKNLFNDKSFEMYFLRVHFWCALMVWNVFFDGTSLMCTHVFEMHFFREQFWRALMFWNAFFEGAIVLEIMAADSCGCCFVFHGCWLVWLLLFIFYHSFHHKYNFCSSGGICLEWLPPLWKSSDSLVRVWVTNGMA